MAKFSSEYVYKAMDIKKFYRLPIAFKECHIFVNFGNNSIAKIQDKKMLHNWTLKHPHFFTSPIVCLESENKLCCISNSIVLFIWSIEDDTLQNATKIKFIEEIFGVVCASKEKAFLIFNSGKWLNFKDAISDVTPSDNFMLAAEEELVWIDAALYKSEIVLIYLTFLRKEKKYKLFTIFLNETTYTMEHSDTRFIEYEHKTLKSWCLNKQKEDCSFLTLWSNGAVINHNIDKNTYSLVFFVKNIQDHHILAMEVIEWPHMTILNVDNKEDSLLEIWDAKFSALKAQKILHLTNCNYVQLSVIGKEIFFISNDSLIKVPFSLEKSTLAAAIGKSTTSFSKPKEYKWDAKGGMTTLSSSSRIEQDTEFQIQDKIKLIKEGDRCLYYIKEHELIEILLFVIKSQGDDACITDDCRIILNFVFSASYTDVFLIEHLKKLTFDEILLVLNLLGTLFFSQNKEMNDNKPNDFQILKWLFLLIQSHYQNFILKNEKVPVLKEIIKVLYDKMEYYELVNDISSYLSLIKKGNILPERNIREDYCIETLDI